MSTILAYALHHYCTAGLMIYFFFKTSATIQNISDCLAGYKNKMNPDDAVLPGKTITSIFKG